MIERVLLLGHSGFIGSHLERHLQREIGDRVQLVGRSLPVVDLTQMEQVRQLEPHFGRGTCLILAAAMKRQFGDTIDSFHANMLIVQNVCRLIEEHALSRVIYFSSAAVYGEETHNTQICEETPVNPTSFYGISKYTSERLLAKTVNQAGAMSLVCIRPPLVYGAGDEGKSYGPAGFLASAHEDGEVVLWGDGAELREFLHVDDLCSIVGHLIESDYRGELNTVSGISYSFADIVTVLKESFPLLRVSSRERSKQKVDNAFNAERVRKFLPPTFRFTTLREGLKRMVEARRA